MAVKKKLSIPKSASHGIQRTFLGDSTARTAINKPTEMCIRDRIKVFDQTIPRSVRAAEISAVGKSIFQHDPKGKVAEAYKSVSYTHLCKSSIL